MSSLAWLHLSDWHQEGKQFERRKVRDALIKNIKERAQISPDLAHIDFVIFSGDVAYRGVAEEYEAAIKEFFTPVLEAAGVGKDRLFIVPGNHDLDRKALVVLPDNLPQKLKTPEAVNEWLTDERRRRAILQPMEAYGQFIRDYLGKDSCPEPAYGYTRCFDVNGTMIAIVGLNSAWLSAHNRDTQGEVNDRGYLILGELKWTLLSRQ